MTMLRRTFDRRVFLRGAGGVAIALPLLEEMHPRAARAAAALPTRLMTLHFGLGLWPAWQAERFSGPLEPYAPLAPKMAFFTNVSMSQQNPGGAHCGPGAVLFVGEKHQGGYRAGGASIDQVVRQAVDPTGTTLVSGLWFARDACDQQALRVYNPDGTARPPVKRPSAVFDSLFRSLGGGSAPSEPLDPTQTRDRQLRRSVLDTVLAQFQRLTGPSSYLGSGSKQKLQHHLQSIREIELQLAPADDIMTRTGTGGSGSCALPPKPVDPPIADYDQFTFGQGASAPRISWQDIEKVFQLHADLWVVALQCDLVRFGNLMLESAGGHMDVIGTYTALGESTDFPGTSQHDTYFHGNQPQPARLYQHFAQRNLASFLAKLDRVAEPNGQSLLDNTTVVLATEVGRNHDREGLFHAIAGAKGRFKPGFYTQKLNIVDVYNTVLKGHGLPPSAGKRTGITSEGDASSALA